MTGIPWGDWQFVTVTLLAVAAVALFVRSRLRRRSAFEPACPACPHCANDATPRERR